MLHDIQLSGPLLLHYWLTYSDEVSEDIYTVSECWSVWYMTYDWVKLGTDLLLHPEQERTSFSNFILQQKTLDIIGSTLGNRQYQEKRFHICFFTNCVSDWDIGLWCFVTVSYYTSLSLSLWPSELDGSAVLSHTWQHDAVHTNTHTHTKDSDQSTDWLTLSSVLSHCEVQHTHTQVHVSVRCLSD